MTEARRQLCLPGRQTQPPMKTGGCFAAEKFEICMNSAPAARRNPGTALYFLQNLC